MATVKRSNYLPHIQQYLDVQGDPDSIILEVECGVCESRLDISRSARTLSSSDKSRTELLLGYTKYEVEKTVALPCGHVFGESCISDRSTAREDLSCPSCDFKMLYKNCSHAIAPALIPIKGHDPVRDRFPLTIPEGGKSPGNCKQCRWNMIQPQLRRPLSDECAICRQKSAVQLPLDPAEHLRHRDGHIGSGLKMTLAEFVELIWPKFETRETEPTSAETESSEEESELSEGKPASHEDQCRVNLSLLYATVLSELEETVWYRSKTQAFSPEQSRKHAQGIASIERAVLSWSPNDYSELVPLFDGHNDLTDC
ncbi:hypothetical protein F4779DRAFT_640012 [Xylariaceae sp. FL0662B]|nr:hypothetical protein F4779DRAFT_640012 [Xylariaceae sp. FL0662B]